MTPRRLASVVLAAVWFMGVRVALMVDDNLADFGGDEA